MKYLLSILFLMAPFLVNAQLGGGSVMEDRNGNHWVIAPSGFFGYQISNPDFSNAVVAVAPSGGGGGGVTVGQMNAAIALVSTNDWFGLAALLTSQHSTNDGAGVAATLTALHSTNDYQGAAFNSTNGYVWGSLYDAAGLAASLTASHSTNAPYGIYLTTVPVGVTNWIQNSALLTSNQIIAMTGQTISGSNFLTTVPVGATNWLQNVVNLTSNQVISMSQANSNQVINQAGIAVAASNYLNSASTLNGANLTAGSVADSALASTFLKVNQTITVSGLATASGATALALVGSQSLSNAIINIVTNGTDISGAIQFKGNGGGLTNLTITIPIFGSAASAASQNGSEFCGFSQNPGTLAGGTVNQGVASILNYNCLLNNLAFQVRASASESPTTNTTIYLFTNTVPNGTPTGCGIKAVINWNGSASPVYSNAVDTVDSCLIFASNNAPVGLTCIISNSTGITGNIVPTWSIQSHPFP